MRYDMSDEINNKIDWYDTPQGGPYWLKWWEYLKVNSFYSKKPLEIGSVGYFIKHSNLPKKLRRSLFDDIDSTKEFFGANFFHG